MTAPIVVVTGANGFVGSHAVAALSERGATVRAVVRRSGAAPQPAGVEEHVGDFGDITEDSARVSDDASDYSVVKRDIDAALERLGGTPRVLVRPPAILGPGESSVWNTVQPAAVAKDESRRHSIADQTFAWVHADDLAAIIADLATGAIPVRDDVSAGPVLGGCTPVNVASGDAATQRDYLGAITDELGLEPTWDDTPAWTGQIRADRARGRGWSPQVSLDDALAELGAGLRS